MRRRRRFSDGNFAAVAPTIGDSPPRFEPAEGVTAGELDEILQKKELTPREVMVIRQSMVQVTTSRILASESCRWQFPMLTSPLGAALAACQDGHDHTTARALRPMSSFLYCSLNFSRDPNNRGSLEHV